MISGRDEARLRSAAESVPGATVIVADVSDTAGATRLVDEARATLGTIDILITNAGGPPAGNFASTPLEDYQRALDLNLLSVVAMCKAAVPAMQERGWGRVVAITSIAVKQPIAHLILSNTARAGATGFLKTLALEVAADGVTVNSVLPGLTHRSVAAALRRQPRYRRGIFEPTRSGIRATSVGHRVPVLGTCPLRHRCRVAGRRRRVPRAALSEAGARARPPVDDRVSATLARRGQRRQPVASVLSAFVHLMGINQLLRWFEEAGCEPLAGEHFFHLELDSCG